MPVAASELQKLVKTTAQEAGIEVRSERILAPVDRGGYAEVPVEMTLSGPIRGLTAFLHRLEETPVLVAMTDLKVRAPTTGANRELSATIALSGFIPGAPGSGAPRPPNAGSPGADRGLSVMRRLLLLADVLLLVVAAFLEFGSTRRGPPARP